MLAQRVEVEKTHDISGKAKRGYLGNVAYNDNVYALTYVTKASETKAKFETYYFDKDFNFLREEATEEEFEKARLKFKWFTYKGEEYSFEAVSVGGNLTGTLVLKRKLITYKWDWFFGGYTKYVKLLEKFKPKNEDGLKYFYHTHQEDETNGDILVIAGVKDPVKKGGDPFKMYKEMVAIKFNKDFDILSTTPFSFETPHYPVYTLSLYQPNEEDPENNGPINGLVMVMAPKFTASKTTQDPNPRNWFVVGVDAQTKVLFQTQYESPADYWRIDDVFTAPNADGEFYFFGPSVEGKGKYQEQLVATTKFKSLQVMHVSQGKIAYVTLSDLDELEAKLKTPPSQKKTPQYNGKKFDYKGGIVTTSGDFFIFGQNFDPQNDGTFKYKDVVAFHFGPKGELKSQYGVDTRENNNTAQSIGAIQYPVEGESGKNLYWVMAEVDGYKAGGNNPRPLIYPRIARVELGPGTVGDFINLGKVDKKEFYIDNKYPYLPVDGGKLAFFGSDKAGKTIWFARVAMD